MTTEYRIIFTATFATEAERDKMYEAIKAKIATFAAAGNAKRADMTKDSYLIPDQLTEKVI